MDTSSSSTSPVAKPMDQPIPDDYSKDPQVDEEVVPDKISAYYSLAFPNFTYYLQTLSVTIGRRPVRPGVASSSDGPQVDVDLGPLKSVSRLHARIEYEEEQERFVLVVLGRNGAWVDGVWSGSGSRVPLGARSQIQIATRVFHFVLPPPPAPEDSPSPSSPSSTTRHLSPSIDITSLSPDSSLPSPSAHASELPNTESSANASAQKTATDKSTIAKPNGKKRKKSGTEVPPPPEVMPPRPQYTYAQLCYRAIRSMDGKATLQEICAWVAENFEWYRYNVGSGWESSIRHNLSSNRAFKKMERCAGERGKGFFWSVDPKFEHSFVDLEAKVNGSAVAGGKDGVKAKARNYKGGASLEPALKRSVKADVKAPLPPPLTSTPLPAFPSSTSSTSRQHQQAQASSSVHASGAPVEITIKTEENTSSLPSLSFNGHQRDATTPPLPPGSAAWGATTTNTPGSSLPAIPPDMIVPIVIGVTVAPSTSPPADASFSKNSILDLSSPPISLKGDTIILNPTIFSSLTPEQLKELEALGARKAIEILQSYIVRFLKERIKTEGSKGKGKARSKRAKGQKVKVGRGVGSTGDQETSRSGAFTDAVGAEGTAKRSQVSSVSTKAKKIDTSSGPFTTAPLPPRKLPPQTQGSFGVPTEIAISGAAAPAPNNSASLPNAVDTPSASASGHTTAHTRTTSPPPMAHLEEPMEHISITDDDVFAGEGHAAKRRRLEVLGVLG